MFNPRSFSESAGWDHETREAFKPPMMQEAAAADAAMRHTRQDIVERWSHKNEGTPQTHEHAARTHQGALAGLHARGVITAEQLGWAVEIASVAEAIERDVAMTIVSYEPRIDNSASARNVLVEGLMKARRELAYSRWRKMLPMPKRLVLDMLVGEPIGYATAARRYGVHYRKVKKYLLRAIDRWPECMDWAENQLDREELERARDRLL